MLWALLFALPVLKMALFALFIVMLRRADPESDELVEVRRSFAPRPGGPRPRTGRGGPRSGLSARERARAGTRSGR